MVLRLWVAIRITTSSERICGEDTLGMPSNIMDQSSPLHNKIPIPPVMGAQTDYIMTQAIQLPLRRLVLDQLQKLILSNKSNTWFCVYICTFILLHNCSKIITHDHSYAVKHGLNVSKNIPVKFKTDLY